MSLSDAIEKLGRTIFERPFHSPRGADETPELAEVRLAVLDAVKSKSHRVGGAQVFPYNVVRILLRGIPEAQAELFQSGFLARYFDEELRGALARSNYRAPQELEIEFHSTPALPGPNEEWILVETELRASAVPQAAPMPGAAKLVVVRGTASEPEIVLNKARTNIGRTVEVFRAEGPSRRNDLVFTEETEINRTVSREHAHILFNKKSGDYRLFNDRWYKASAKPEANCGIWIVREGLSQPVHRGERGVVLSSGDEIHLGQAVLRFVAE